MESTREKAFAAVRAGDAKVLAELLVSDSLLANARDDSGLSLLLQACYFKNRELVDLIQAAKSCLDIFETAALPSAIEQGLQLLGADPSLTTAWSCDGFTPLHLASYFGNDAMVNLLLRHGADPNAVSRNRMVLRPMHSAAASRSVGIVETLLAHGAEVNATQHGGWTPLHAAVASGDGPLVKLLLAHGADPNLGNDDGKSALDLALERGHSEITLLLRYHTDN
ncbi:MAG: ankyrin repeat domain-containing protein [Isosphaeraceae bacterium]